MWHFVILLFFCDKVLSVVSNGPNIPGFVNRNHNNYKEDQKTFLREEQQQTSNQQTFLREEQQSYNAKYKNEEDFGLKMVLTGAGGKPEWKDENESHFEEGKTYEVTCSIKYDSSIMLYWEVLPYKLNTKEFGNFAWAKKQKKEANISLIFTPYRQFSNFSITCCYNNTSSNVKRKSRHFVWDRVETGRNYSRDFRRKKQSSLVCDKNRCARITTGGSNNQSGSSYETNYYTLEFFEDADYETPKDDSLCPDWVIAVIAVSIGVTFLAVCLFVVIRCIRKRKTADNIYSEIVTYARMDIQEGTTTERELPDRAPYAQIIGFITKDEERSKK